MEIIGKCCICGGDDFKSVAAEETEGTWLSDLGIVDIYSTVICNSCGWVFKPGKMSDSQLNELYNKYGGDFTFDPQHKELTHLRSTQLYEWINKYIKGNNRTLRLLDIGGGTGHVLEVFAENNNQIDVVDIAGNNSIHHLIKIIRTDIYNFNKNKNYDIVFMNHVLEHVWDPDRMIRRARELIKDNGYIYVEVPFELYTPLINKRLGDPCHVGYFTIANLETLLHKEKFKVVKSERSLGRYGSRRVMVLRILGRKIKEELKKSKIHRFGYFNAYLEMIRPSQLRVTMSFIIWRIYSKYCSKSIICDKLPSYRKLFREKKIARPKDWQDIIDLASKKLTGNNARFNPIKLIYSAESIGIFYRPSALLILLLILKRDVYFLCWGTPKKSKLWFSNYIKETKFKFILNNVKGILVNEAITSNDVLKISGRKSSIIPYVVDTDFFYYTAAPLRKDFILVPGNNDRDEQVVINIAQEGHRVIRMTRDPSVLVHYANNDKVEIQFNISNEKVRELYQSAKMVALPLETNNHAAAQTAVLEAISTGAPVVISKGRTSSILEQYEGITVCDSNNILEWLEAIKTAENIKEEQRKKSANLIRNENSPHSVVQRLLETLK